MRLAKWAYERYKQLDNKMFAVARSMSYPWTYRDIVPIQLSNAVS